MWKYPMSKMDWLQLAAVRRDVKRGTGTRAEMIFFRNKMKDEVGNRNITVFNRYWLLLDLKKDHPESVTDEKIKTVLEECKALAIQQQEYRSKFLPEDDTFKGHPVRWEPFMKYDERFNTYDHRTERAVLPWRLTDEERKEFHDTFYQPYRLCEDGRDCSGTWQHTTSVYRCKDRTIVMRHKSCDC